MRSYYRHLPVAGKVVAGTAVAGTAVGGRAAGSLKNDDRVIFKIYEFMEMKNKKELPAGCGA